MRYSRITRTLSIMAAVTITWATAASAQLNDGLIAHWSFDEGAGAVAQDSAGSHDLSLSLGATWSPTGVAGSALNTRTGAAMTPHAADLELGGSFSVAFWARKDTGGSAALMTSVVSQHYCGQNNDGSWDVQFVPEPGAPNANVSLYTWPSTGPQSFGAPTPGLIDIGAWHHVVVTHDAASGVSTIYLDGEPLRSEIWLPGTGGSPAPLLVGTDHYLEGGSFCGSNHFFDGDIDELRLYNRPLSGIEVALLIAVDTRNVLPIISGTDGAGHPGALNALDPLTRFQSASTADGSAKVGTGQATQYPTDTPPDFVGSPLSQGVTTYSANDLWADYHYRFPLPGTCVNPVLRLAFTADDTTQVYLNGHFLGVFGDQAIAHELVVDNADWFQTLSNELKFRVINNPWNPLVWVEGGVARGGDRDGMWLEVEGFVAYDDAPTMGVFVVDYIRNVIEQFDTNGDHVTTFLPDLAGSRSYDALFTPDGRQLIVLSGTEGNGGAGLFDAVTGEFVRWLVQNPTDWYTSPTTYNFNSAAWGPDGALYLTRNGINEGQGAGGVTRYEWPSGPTSEIISGLSGATTGLAFSAEGHLFLSEPHANHVREYVNNGGVWSNVRTLNVSYPAGTAVGPDGHLYVAQPLASAVHEFALSGNPPAWTQVQALPCGSLSLYGVVGLDFGPDGDLYITMTSGDRIARYDLHTEACNTFITYDPLVEAVATALQPMRDCNGNCIPDDEDLATCDGSAWCTDCNTNGMPDGCEPDFDSDGLIDDCDPDIDNDGVPNEDDVCDHTPTGATVITDPESSLYGTLQGDYDGDCDVDLQDFARFEQEITGPN